MLFILVYACPVGSASWRRPYGVRDDTKISDIIHDLNRKLFGENQTQVTRCVFGDIREIKRIGVF